MTTLSAGRLPGVLPTHQFHDFCQKRCPIGSYASLAQLTLAPGGWDVVAANDASAANRSVPERRKNRTSSTRPSRSIREYANLEPSARNNVQRTRLPTMGRAVALPPFGMAKRGDPPDGGDSRRLQGRISAEVEPTAPCAASPLEAGADGDRDGYDHPDERGDVCDRHFATRRPLTADELYMRRGSSYPSN